MSYAQIAEALLAKYESIAAEAAAMHGIHERIRVRFVDRIERVDDLIEIGGRAYWDGDAFTIEIREYPLERKRDSTFAHELGHILAGHVARRSQYVPAAESRTYRERGIKGLLDPDAQTEWDRREREADEWGAQIRAAYFEG